MKISTMNTILALLLAMLWHSTAAGQFQDAAKQGGQFADASTEPAVVVVEPPVSVFSPDEVALSEIVGHEQLGGITLPEGFKFTKKQNAFCSYYGGISGPHGIVFTVSVFTPAPPEGEPRTSGHYERRFSAAGRFPDRCKVRNVNGERLEVAIVDEHEIYASYPGRELDLTAKFADVDQLTDVLLVLASIPNERRNLSWANALIVLKEGQIHSLKKMESLGVEIVMANGVKFVTQPPKATAVIDALQACGRYGTAENQLTLEPIQARRARAQASESQH